MSNNKKTPPDYWTLEDLTALIRRVRAPLTDQEPPVPALVGFIVLGLEVLQFLQHFDIRVGVPAEFMILKVALSTACASAMEHLHAQGLTPDIVGQADKLAQQPPTTAIN